MVPYQLKRVIEQVIGVQQRTRRIDLVPIWDVRAGAYPAYAGDTHGALNSDAHIDETDNNATYKEIAFARVVMPTDYVVGTVTFKWMASSSAAGNNYVWQPVFRTSADSGTTMTLLEAPVLVEAVAAAADTLKIHSRAIAANPAAGTALYVRLDFKSNDASDSNTGTRTLWAAWLEYTASL